MKSAASTPPYGHPSREVETDWGILWAILYQIAVMSTHCRPPAGGLDKATVSLVAFGEVGDISILLVASYKVEISRYSQGRS